MPTEVKAQEKFFNHNNIGSAVSLHVMSIDDVFIASGPLHSFAGLIRMWNLEEAKTVQDLGLQTFRT
jgi:hypothetical protein